jgi:hypothetical protein
MLAFYHRQSGEDNQGSAKLDEIENDTSLKILERYLGMNTVR